MWSPRLWMPLILVSATCGMLAQEPTSRIDDLVAEEAAIHELVRRGAVVKRFEVRETETAGLLVRLKAHHLDSQGIVDDGVVTTLGKLKDLSIELRGLPLSDEGLKQLLAKISVVGLDVSGSQITDRGLIGLERAKSSLRLLDLSFTRIDDRGLLRLLLLSELRHLSLIECRITDAGVDSLRKLVALRELYLEKTAVTANGVQQLHTHLPKCRILR